MIKAVIFDNNGTLENDLELAVGSMTEIFNRYNISPPSREQFRQQINSSYMDFYYSHGFKINFSGGGLKEDADAINAIRKEYYEKHKHLAHFRQDAIKTILHLKLARMKVAIVSSEMESILVPKLDKAGIVSLLGLDMIRAGVYGDKSSVLLDVCKNFGIKPEEAVYVDDTVDGTGAAKRAGLTAIAFGNGFHTPERLKKVTHLMVNELSRVQPLIELLNDPGCSI